MLNGPFAVEDDRFQLGFHRDVEDMIALVYCTKALEPLI